MQVALGLTMVCRGKQVATSWTKVCKGKQAALGWKSRTEKGHMHKKELK